MIVLVTGTTSGFGKKIAVDLVKDGHTVIGTGRRVEKLEQLKTQLGENFIALPFDLTSLEETRVAIDKLMDVVDRVDVLINNAGLALGLESASEADIADWHTMINTNIIGLCNLTSLILPKMVAINAGLIINIGSIAGSYPYPGGNVYGASKAFVKQFSLNLRADLKDKKVRITNLEPGMCGETEFSNVRFKGDDIKAGKVYENTSYIKPEDISNIITWLIAQPEHININSLEVMPTSQTFSPLYISRQENISKGL